MDTLPSTTDTSTLPGTPQLIPASPETASADVPPAPSPLPVYIPAPIITPSVFEGKPGRLMVVRRKMRVRTWIGILLLIAVIVITILYFWGKEIAGRS